MKNNVVEPKTLNVAILESFRNGILNALGHADLKTPEDFKLSQVKSHSTCFRVEILNKALTWSRIQTIVKNNRFEYTPRFKNIGSFVEINLEKEYEYLSNG
jgi:hypothetical protein